jgi:hypothetical protein
MELKLSLPCSQKTAWPFEMFHKMLVFYGEDLLLRAPPHKLEDYPLSAVRDWYSIYSQVSSIPIDRLLHPQPEDAPCRGDRGPHYTAWYT